MNLVHKSGIPNVVHHRQNPSESTCNSVCVGNPNPKGPFERASLRQRTSVVQKNKKFTFNLLGDNLKICVTWKMSKEN
jgi:hypothetical protein